MSTDFNTYPQQDGFSVVGETFAPHPYMITPYHLENNPHHTYIGKEQIEQMESDISHSLCGWGRTASGKNEKKGETACDLLYAEHNSVLVVKVPSVEPDDNRDTNERIKSYLEHIKEQAESDGYAGFALTLKEE